MNEFKISWVAHTTLETTAIPHLRNLSVQRFLKYASHVLENRSKTPVRPQERRLGAMFNWWPPAGLGENDCLCLVCQHFCDHGDYSNFQKNRVEEHLSAGSKRAPRRPWSTVVKKRGRASQLKSKIDGLQVHELSEAPSEKVAIGSVFNTCGEPRCNRIECESLRWCG